MESPTYVQAKRDGLINALGVDDITITGFHITPVPATRRQTMDTFQVTTSFTVTFVEVPDIGVVTAFSAQIEGSAAAIKNETDQAMSTANWSDDPTFTEAPVMSTPVVATPIMVTAAPTPSPKTVPPAGATVTAAATGDPHLRNILGERFDLMQVGRHTLIHIPKGAGTEGTLLRVDANAQSLDGSCMDMYFQEVNLTGKWADDAQAGGFKFRAADPVAAGEHRWLHFGKVDLKVVHGHTLSGLSYLNLYVKHLRSAGFTIGGLLGEDDHSQAATPPEGCVRRMQLSASRRQFENSVVLMDALSE